MKLAHLVALCSAVGFASAGFEHEGVFGLKGGVGAIKNKETIISPTTAFTVPLDATAGSWTTYHYVGYGRAAVAKMAPTARITSICTTATAKTELVYAERDHMAISQSLCKAKKWMPEDNTPESDCARPGMCIPVALGQKKHCVAVSLVDNHKFGASKEFVSTLLWTGGVGVAGTYTADHAKAHGTGKYEWFVRTTIEVTGAPGCGTAADIVMDNIQPYNPDQQFCVGRNDDNEPLSRDDNINYKNIRPDNWHMYPFVNQSHDIGYFSSERRAGVPTHPGIHHFAEDFAVHGPTAAEASTTHYLNLGASPQIEYSCLNVYLTNVRQTTDANCNAVQKGFGQNAGNVADWDLELLEVDDCGVHPYPESECCAMNKDECGATTTRANQENKCWWNEQEKQCYKKPASRVSMKDGTEVLGKKGEDQLASTDKLIHSFVANDANGPASSWVSNDDVIKRGIDGLNRKRWFLALSVSAKPAGADARCEWEASVSFNSYTTGGICEPTTRLRCEHVAEQCFSQEWPITAWPRYWRVYEKSDLVASQNSESKYKTCNCLKQKEICYRQGGCFATKKYELILQNCREEECGNWCNSAGLAQYSFMAVALAALAMLL